MKRSFGYSRLEQLESRQLLSLTPSLVEVPMPASAVQADPTLANYKILDLQVTVDPGEKWEATDMQAELTAGNFYNVDPAAGGADFAQKSVWGILPVVQADSMVCSSGFGRPFILGEYNPTLGNGGVFKPKEMNVAWGSLTDTGTGTFTVARLTISKDASGTVSGDLGSSEVDANKLKPYSFTIKGGVVSTGGDSGGGGDTLSSISGNLFNDTNGNGLPDEGVPLVGFKVYLDKNNNGKFDSGEKNQLTDSSGNYSFDSLTPGTYYVREVLPTGWTRTSSTGKYTVVLSSGVDGTHKDFGLKQNSQPTLSAISGNLFNDSNGNGKADEGSPLVGFKVYLDKNNNGHFDSGEKYKLTDSSGNYTFDSLTAGTYYVREILPTGYRRTSSTGKYTVVLSSGVDGTHKDFGLTTTALLSGTVFSDKNSNDKLDSGETGIQGFTIWLDSNSNGKLDSGEKIAGTDKDGYWVFKAVKPGTYVVRIQSQSNYKTIGVSSITMKLGSGGSYTGRLFAEHKIA